MGDRDGAGRNLVLLLGASLRSFDARLNLTVLMKILFVNPSLRPDAPHRYIPVGLGYVVTAVKEAGFDFDILDIDIGGHTDEQVEKYVATHRYDVVALGAIVTHYRWIKWFISTLKSYQPGCTVIVGNSVGGSIPEVLFTHTPADVIVRGEGDFTIVELLEALRDGKELGRAVEPEVAVPHTNGGLQSCVKGVGIEGIIFRDARGRFVDNGARKAAKILDDLPYPDWDLFDVESYLKRGAVLARTTRFYPADESVVLPVSTARGCVFKCTFCHYVFWNDPYRHRSAASIIGEIGRNQKKYGVNYVSFWDELSFHKLGPAEKFVDALLEADLGVHWSGAVRADLFGREDIPYEDRHRVAKKFYDAGCCALGYSLESGNDEILESMNKRIKASYFAEQVKILREVGIASNTSLVIGYPQETAETIADTMRMCERTGIYPSVGFLLPLPSTGMWEYAVKNGFISDPDHFLTTVTERQDIILNMTSMETEKLLSEVKGWLRHLSQAFGNGLDENSLIRTGGYYKHNKHQVKVLEKHRNTNDSLNYATVSGTL